MYRTIRHRHVYRGRTRFVYRGKRIPHRIIERTWAFLTRAKP
jgi:hypothetical protein